MAIVGGHKRNGESDAPSYDSQTVEMGERVYAEFKRYRVTVAQIKADCEARLIAAERMFATRVEAIVQMNSPVESAPVATYANGDVISE